jgi:hypothetical protein
LDVAVVLNPEAGAGVRDTISTALPVAFIEAIGGGGVAAPDAFGGAACVGAFAGAAFAGSGATPIPRANTDPMAPIRSMADTVFSPYWAAADVGAGAFAGAFAGACSIVALGAPAVDVDAIADLVA